MNDIIYRQAAIDVLEERLQANGYSNTALVSELNRSIGYLMRLPSAQQWIPCSERLPEANNPVLLCTRDSIYIAMRFDLWDLDWYETTEYRRIEGASAWMPLPEPYKEVKQ